jgi:tRNA 5-methylaminomethyl-2-thiouridine biosynthesis bifunctional protein
MKTAIIIGGGIAGCSTAYTLAQRGFTVTLLERQTTLAAEASGNPLAVLYPRLTGQDTPLEQLNFYGYFHSLDLLNSLGIERCQYLACGVAQLLNNQKAQARLPALISAYQNTALFERMDAVQLSQLAGLTLQHEALYFPQAGGIHLPALCQVLVSHSNIQVLHHHTDLRIERQQQWQVTSENGLKHAADIVVIANANDATQLTQSQHIPLAPIRGQLSYLKATQESENLKTIVCADGYITPAIDQVHYLGASFSQQDSDVTLRTTDHESNLQLLKDISPELNQALKNEVISGRVAWRSQTPDYLPAAGQLLDAEALMTGKFYYNDAPAKLPWLAGLYVNIGHGSKGFLSAPLCAQVIADHAAGLPSPVPKTLLNAMQPNRFILRKLGLKQLAQHLIQ